MYIQVENGKSDTQDNLPWSDKISQYIDRITDTDKPLAAKVLALYVFAQFYITVEDDAHQVLRHFQRSSSVRGFRAVGRLPAGGIL